jgi:Arc/MetJ family transcription regulator
MSSTVDGVDADALAAAQQALGTAGSQDTVNAALREVVRQKLVHAFVDRMSRSDPEELERLRDEAWQ